MALDERQLILLDNLIYLNRCINIEEQNQEDLTVGLIVNDLLTMEEDDFEKEVTDEQFYYCNNMVNGMNAEEWRNILTVIQNDATLMEMQITNIEDDNDYGIPGTVPTGFRAACFTNGDDTAVIFRGTVGDYQWADNGIGGTSDATPSQLEAYQYLSGLSVEDVANNNLYVSGHSKGGNMAQFASLYVMKNYPGLNIEMCLSFNGQGFSQQFFDTAESRGLLTEEALSKIYKISSQDDVVNALFLPLENADNRTYIRSSGDIDSIADILLVGHIGSNVITSEGELNTETNPRTLNVFVHELMKYMYENVPSEQCETVCQGLMGILADNHSFEEILWNVCFKDEAIKGVLGLPFFTPIPNKYKDAISGLGDIFTDFIQDETNKALLYITLWETYYSTGSYAIIDDQLFMAILNDLFGPDMYEVDMEKYDRMFSEYISTPSINNVTLKAIFGTSGNDNLRDTAAEKVPLTIKGFAGNDTITGSEYGDMLYGGDGNDTIYGGGGNDYIVGEYGDDRLVGGNDIINEQNANSENDRILFGEGISANDIYAVQNGNNLVLSIMGTEATLTVTNQFSNPGYAIERFELSDGRVITNVQLNQLIQSMASFESETGMLWNDAIEQKNETAMSIVENIWMQKQAV